VRVRVCVIVCVHVCVSGFDESSWIYRSSLRITREIRLPCAIEREREEVCMCVCVCVRERVCVCVCKGVCLNVKSMCRSRLALAH